MRLSQVSALVLYTALSVTANSETILSDADVAAFPSLGFGVALQNTDLWRRSASSRSCKVFPGDKDWPSSKLWRKLDAITEGALDRPDPIGSVCFPGDTYSASECATVTAEWSDSVLHINHPSSVMSPLYTGNTCLPVDGNVEGRNCTLGGYPVYVLTARNPRDVQAGVNFARNHNIRLIVKNTGHDFAGKSSGSGSLSIRTHLLKDIEIIKSYNSKHYSGPAIKAGSGVQVSELYAAAHEAGLMAVGGEGITVGWGGGYIAGGGHSPLSSIHGLASDQALSFSIVLPNGRLVTADPSTNPDLFWALRGGGGSTFGVVVSITVKAFPDIPITTSIFSFDSSPADLAAIAAGDLSNSNFWSLVKFYLTLFPAHADAGIYSYWFILPVAATPGAQKFLMQPFFAPNKTVADVTALLQPLIAAAAALSIQIDPTTTQYPGFHPAWANGFPKEAMGGWNAHIGSRLFPRTNWNSPEKLDAQFTALRGTGVTFLIGFNIAPTLRAGNVSANETAANPAWRSALMHVIVGTDVGINERDPEVVRKTVLQFTDGPMRKWKEASVGSGAYLGESDTMDPDWQQAFYGSSYPRLYRIKQEYDPRGVFFAETAVGSEDWSTGPYRTARLCPV